MDNKSFKDCFGKDCSSIKNKKLFLFDMDGTIYCENKLFDGVKELLESIKSEGKNFVFITNNSSKSVMAYVQKLLGMGLDVNENNFLTSTQATILHLKNNHPCAKVYAQGTKSFIGELKNNGIDVTEEYDESVDVILVGFDNEITAQKMRTTCKMLTLNKNAVYYATNPDYVCPVDFGFVPDCGSMCFSYEKATGRKPIYIGKPHPEMINIAIKKFGCEKSETIVVGDRIYTDIASGNNAGVETVLVLSGETSLNQYVQSEIKADFVLNSVKEILEIKEN